MMRHLLLLFIFFLVLSGCDRSEKKTFDLLITNVSIIDIENDSIIPDQFIAIQSDTIRLVQHMEGIGDYSSRDTVNAENRYAMPGLWDMHVHFRGGDSLINENKRFLKLFLAFGITTVRDAGGDITPAVMNWKNDIAQNVIDGPEIFSSGPKLDGKNPAWDGSISITNSEEVRFALDSLENIKVDFVKIYDGSLDANTFYEILQQAEIKKLRTTSHVPLSADLIKAIDLGLDGVEHMYYIVKAVSPLADSLSQTDLGYGMMPQLINTFDKDLAQEVYTKLAKEQVSVTPTMHIGTVLGGLADNDHASDSLKNYMGKGIQKTYRGRIESAFRAKNSGSTMRQDLANLSAKMIVPMYRSGVNILAGSDSGAYNSFVYPGESLHAELEELVEAGLRPAEALQTSIINGPKFFGLEEHYGSLEKGKKANILILNANPLKEIKNTRTIEMIIKGTSVYTPDELLKAVKN